MDGLPSHCVLSVRNLLISPIVELYGNLLSTLAPHLAGTAFHRISTLDVPAF